MIYVSTGGFPSQTGAEAALSLFENGIDCVELSGGVHSPSCVTDLSGLPEEINLQVHNYFPPPLEPFVFNLASSDETTFSKSFDHVRSAINLASTLGLKYYSFHGGFRISPKVEELGGLLCGHPILDREQAHDIFEKAIRSLSVEAEDSGISLLVENNVLTSSNLEAYGEDPLLFTEPFEIVSFMEKMPPNIGLLLDVGHLKVTAETLGFDRIRAHDMLNPFVRAYHLSDNDGRRDSNECVSEESWFWKVINPQLDYYSLEIYDKILGNLVSQREIVKKKLKRA